MTTKPAKKAPEGTHSREAMGGSCGPGESFRRFFGNRHKWKGVELMGIIKAEDLIAWQDGSRIVCPECDDPPEGKPLTKDDFTEDDIVICDECGGRIL